MHGFRHHPYSPISPRTPSPPPLHPSPPLPDPVFEPDSSASSLSFIVAIEAVEKGKIIYLSESITEILGHDPKDVLGIPASEFCHPDDAPSLYKAYQEMIAEDKAACLLYIRLVRKGPAKNYMLMSVTCSRVGMHLIGACSAASSALKAVHNASTATEVVVIAPMASHLEFRRWNVPPSFPQSDSSGTNSPSSRNSEEPPSPNVDNELMLAMTQLVLTQPPPDRIQSKRSAFVLERFSVHCPILYSTNDEILPRSLVYRRPFYDFVAPGKSEHTARGVIDMVKTWGVNEKGSPSDGGFAFSRFKILLKGRNSTAKPIDPAPLRNRRTSPLSDNQGVRPYRDGRTSSVPQSSLSGSSPTSEPSASSVSLSKGSRTKKLKLKGAERGVDSSDQEMTVDAIFSPQSDGILVILRPAVPTAAV